MVIYEHQLRRFPLPLFAFDSGIENILLCFSKVSFFLYAQKIENN